MTTPTDPPLRDSTRAAVAAACRQHHIRPDGISHAIDLLGDLRRYELPGAQLDHAGLDADLAIVARTPDLTEPPEYRAVRVDQARQAMARSTGGATRSNETGAALDLPPLPALPSRAAVHSAPQQQLVDQIAARMLENVNRTGQPLFSAQPNPDNAA